MDSISNWIDQLNQLITASQKAWGVTFTILGILWLIQLINWSLKYRLNILGIWPRKLWGLPGIIFSPFLHGNWNHLFFNSIPLLILINLNLLMGWAVFYKLSIFIILVSGFATWLIGRPGIHVGASGVLMGYWGFLLAQAYLNPSVLGIIVGALCLYYLGGLWLNLLPSGAHVSVEGHIAGCLAGIAAVYVLRFI